MATLTEHLTCSCCSKLMTKPYSLKCKHSFCHRCCLKTKAKNVITCPRCQHKTEVSKIQEDNIRKELVDIFHLEVPSQFNLETDFKNILDQAVEIDTGKKVGDAQQILIHRYTAYLKLFENFTSTVQNRLDLLSELESLPKRKINSAVAPFVTSWLDSHAHYESFDDDSQSDNSEKTVATHKTVDSGVNSEYAPSHDTIQYYQNVNYQSLCSKNAFLNETKHADLDYSPRRLHIVGDTLWCTGTRGDSHLYVYNKDLQLLRSINLQSIRPPRNIIPDGHGGIIAFNKSRQSGLHRFNNNGKRLSNFASGSFCDIAYHQDMLWALEFVKASVFKFAYDAGIQLWTEVGRVKLAIGFSCNDTIFVCDTERSSLHIYTCSLASGHVYKFNKTGQVIEKYDSTDITSGFYKVSGVDRIGNVLISDANIFGVKVYSHFGCETVRLRYKPTDSVLDDQGNMWICSSKNKTLVKYTIESKEKISMKHKMQDSKGDSGKAKKLLTDMTQPCTSSDKCDIPITPPDMTQPSTSGDKCDIPVTPPDDLKSLADQVEAILLRKDGYMGLQCYEEHELVLVDIYKDDVDELTTILRKKLGKKMKKLRIMEQDEKWAPSGDPVEICKLDTYVSQRGNVGTLAQVFVSSDSGMSESGWYVMTCKHVIGSSSADHDDVHAIQIKDTVINDPVVYSAMCPDIADQYSSEYFVDVALVKIDENTKTKLLQNNYIGKYLNCYCDKLGCNHVKIESTVSKIGTKTNKTYGKILNLNARIVHFKKYTGMVCLVGDRENVFNEEGDSGALVVAEDIQHPHAIGLISSHISKYRTLNRKTLKPVSIHATCVVYLDSCIEALKAKFPEIQDIKIVCGEGQYLNRCN